MLTQGDKTGDRTIADVVKKYIAEKYNKPGKVYLGTPHRIDRPVSGVLVLTRTSKAHERMTELFRERGIQKEYVALVDSRDLDKTKLDQFIQDPSDKNPTYSLTNFLVKDKEKNTVKCCDSIASGAKKSKLLFQIGLSKSGRTAIHVFPETSRPHQIRVQLAAIGLSIIGDLKYGYPKPNKDKNICLASKAIEFIHPVKKEPVKVEIGVPPNWNF